jgi:hypothetical protein
MRLRAAAAVSILALAAGCDGSSPEFQSPGSCDTWAHETGDPIEGLVPGEWTFVDFPEAHCMDGSSTGIGVNLSPNGTEKIVFFLEGGNACFSELTCALVANPDGYGAEKFAGDTDMLSGYGIFDRDDPENPVRDFTFVYVPYCSGDVHAGAAVDGYGGREQVGYLNVGEYLERVVPTFPATEQVLLTGISAGGFGAFANFEQVQQAFGCTEVVLLDDSGPVVSDEYLGACLQNIVRDLWKYPIPEGCPTCAGPDGTGLWNAWRYIATVYPDRRFGFLSSTGDTNMSFFLGLTRKDTCDALKPYAADEFAVAIDELRSFVGPYDNVHTFYVEGRTHTMLRDSLDLMAGDDLSLRDFIAGLLEGGPGFVDAGP